MLGRWGRQPIRAAGERFVFPKKAQLIKAAGWFQAEGQVREICLHPGLTCLYLPNHLKLAHLFSPRKASKFSEWLFCGRTRIMHLASVPASLDIWSLFFNPWFST